MSSPNSAAASVAAQDPRPPAVTGARACAGMPIAWPLVMLGVFTVVSLVTLGLGIRRQNQRMQEMRLELELLKREHAAYRAEVIQRMVTPDTEALKGRIAALEAIGMEDFKTEVVNRVNEIIEQLNAQKEVIENLQSARAGKNDDDLETVKSETGQPTWHF